MKLLTKIYLAFGFILLVFAFVTVSHVLQSGVVKSDVEEAVRTTEVVRLSETLEKAIVDTETGVRGFQVSDNEAFLEPYHNGLQVYEKTHSDLQKLLKDPNQIERLAAIDSTFQHWLTSFGNRSVALQRQSLVSAEGKAAFEDFRVNVIRQGVGRQIMDSIRDQVAEFDKQEIILRDARMRDLNYTLRFTDNLAISLMVICFAVAFFIVQVLVKAIRDRLVSLGTMAEEIAKGHFKARVADTRNDEITEVSRSLNIMARRLDESFTDLKKINNELDQFAYVVSHDLKAPLRAINSLAEWIEEDLGENLDPDVKRNLQLLRGRVFRMENLINGILSYSRIGRKELPKQRFSTHKLVNEIADTLNPDKKAQIDVQPNLPELYAEHILLQQVFSNLISNGIKYNDKALPHISIGGVPKDSYYEFWVQDNGPGIPQEFHHKVFGIFQTMEARDTKESTGIGLAIVKKIIEEKGGTIKLESDGKNGSRFVFTWPLEAALETQQTEVLA